MTTSHSFYSTQLVSLWFLFSALVGSAHSLKCTSCAPCSQGQGQDSSQSVDCGSDVCFTEKYEGRVTKGCLSREELDKEGIQIGGVGHVRLNSNGKEMCYCSGNDYCDCGGFGVADVGEQKTKWTDMISTSKWSDIKTFVISKLELCGTLWTDLKTSATSRLGSIWDGIKSVFTWKSKSTFIMVNDMNQPESESPTMKCYSCVAPCSQDTTESVDCEGYCYREKYGGEVTSKGCASTDVLKKIGVQINGGYVQTSGSENINIVNQVSFSGKAITRISRTDGETEKFYCRGEDYCNGD